MSAPAPEGPAEVTHRRMWRIAGPIVLSNATVPLLGAVDTGVVGQMGPAAPIGAVGLGAVILATLYWVFGFLRMGTSGLAAQAKGADDAGERTAVLLRALIVGLAAGVGLILLQWALFAAAFGLAPASAEVEGLTRQYLAIRIWGAPATIGLYAVTGWLIGVERTRAVFFLQLWINGINIVLDLWFVLSLGWGVPGVAAATLIAEWTGIGLGLWFCRDAFGAGLAAARARVGERAALARMFAVNRDIMIRSVALQLCFTTFVYLGARYGDVTLAANQVLLQFLGILSYALDGFAFAAETLVGQAIGARAVAQVRQAIRLALMWTFWGGVVLGLVFWLAGPWLIDLMATDPEVRVEARRYLPWIMAAPVFGALAWAYDGIYIGALLTVEMRRLMLTAAAAYVVALGLLLPFGNHGLWAALMVLFAARSGLMHRNSPKVAARAQGLLSR
jgi:multidrug resistance protein, MATE family